MSFIYKDGTYYSKSESGGQGGGHEILDNGTAMAQEDALNFTDFDISDDSTNSETDIKAHRLTAAELAEACSPLPQTKVDMPILFDERGTERVVGYYVLSDGTKKPVYEKCIVLSSSQSVAVNGEINVGTIANIEKVLNISTFSGGTSWKLECYISNDSVRIVNYSTVAKNIKQITIRYTKTTDTPE